MRYITTIAFIALALAGCQNLVTTTEQTDISAQSTLRTTNAQQTVRGQLSFLQTIQGVRITGEITGLQPNQHYAIHIHEMGACGNNGLDAGEHFDPNHSHDEHHDHSHHHSPAGDLPNITANAQGIAKVDYINSQVSLKQGQADNIQGRSIIVHANLDDYSSQSTGHGNDRAFCGVIQ